MNPIDKRSVYLAGGLMASGTTTVFTLFPLLLGAAAEERGYTETQLGDMVAAFYFGTAAMALPGILWVRQFDWRHISFTGFGLALIAYALMPAVQSYSGLLILMISAGAALGITYVLALTLFGDSSTPQRAFGIKLALETIPGAILVLLVPIFLPGGMPKFQAIVYVLLITTAFVTGGTLAIPRHGVKNRRGPRFHELWSKASILPVLALIPTFFVMCAQTAPWVFLERAAAARQFAAQIVGVALSAALVGSILGGFAVACVGDRFGRVLPVIGGMLVMLSGMALLQFFEGPAFYIAGAVVLMSPANFLLAYTLGLTAELDPHGHLVGLSSASLFTAPVVAPMLTGRLYEHFGFASALLLSAVAVVSCVVTYCALLLGREKWGRSLPSLP